MKRKHRLNLIYAVLSLIIGAAGGYLYGYHKGVSDTPQILLMSHHYSLTKASYAPGLIWLISL